MRYAALVLMVNMAAAAAAGFQVQSHMSEAWDKHTLELRVTAPAKLWFTVPERSGFTVTAKPDTGPTETRSFNMGSAMDLPTPGKYTVTVVRDSGAGVWACRPAQGNPTLLKFTSQADPRHFARVTIVMDEEEETWEFTYPKDATFLVRQTEPGGRVTEEQDLSDSDEVELAGPGTFTLEIAPTEGSGEFSATRSD